MYSISSIAHNNFKNIKCRVEKMKQMTKLKIEEGKKAYQI